MAVVEPTVLPADTWILALSDVTLTGQILVIDQDVEPTTYELAKVQPPGSGAPSSDYDGGVPFKRSARPNSVEPMDIYIIARNYDGKVLIFT